MFLRCISILSLGLLGACGGTSISTAPLSGSGFAAAESNINLGSTFTLPATPRLVGDDEGLAIATQDIEIAISQESGRLDATIAGVTYTLISAGNGSYRLDENDQSNILTRLYVPFRTAEIVELYQRDGTQVNTSTLVFGYDSHPSDVSARRGTATMEGRTVMSARTGNSTGFGDGPVVLNVDFDTATLTGLVEISDSGYAGTPLRFPDVTFAMEASDISENSFAGAVSVAEGDLFGAFSQAQYAGRFYGKGAEAAGGTLVGRVDVEALDQPLFIEGAFLALETP